MIIDRLIDLIDQLIGDILLISLYYCITKDRMSLSAAVLLIWPTVTKQNETKLNRQLGFPY